MRGLGDSLVVEDAGTLLLGTRLGRDFLGTGTFSTRMTGGAVLCFDFWPNSPMTTLHRVWGVAKLGVRDS